MKRAMSVFLVAAMALAAGTVGAADNVLTPEEEAEGWILLFDGQSMNGWTVRGDPEWEVVDGTIRGYRSSGSFAMSTEESFADFHLKVDFWISETANSEILFRGPAEGPLSPGNAYGANIDDNHEHFITGGLTFIQNADAVVKTIGQWSTFEVIADGQHIVTIVNGIKTIDIVDDRYSSGVIGVQYALSRSGELKFRNIKLRRL